MAYRAYVGNLPFSFVKADLENLFKEFGTVKSAEIIMDRETGRSRGFAFVEMETGEQLQTAILSLHGKPIGGRGLTVTEARDRVPGGPGGSAGSRPGSQPGGAFGGPRSGGGAPRGDAGSGGQNGAGAARGPGLERAPDRFGEGAPPRRDRPPERERRPRLADDYNRHDKRWRRGGDDSE